MPSYTHWFNAEKTIIIHEVVGQWSIKDLLEEIDEAAIILETERYNPKYFIFDLSSATGIPSGILSYRNQYDAMIDPDALTIVVGAHRAIQFLTEAMQRLGLPGMAIFVHSRDAALVAIQQHQGMMS